MGGRRFPCFSWCTSVSNKLDGAGHTWLSPGPGAHLGKAKVRGAQKGATTCTLPPCPSKAAPSPRMKWLGCDLRDPRDINRRGDGRKCVSFFPLFGPLMLCH